MEELFKQIGAQPYHKALYRLCKGYNPEYVVEVGTYAGLGAISLALTGKPVVTIDTSHQKLRETLAEKADLLKENGIDGIRAMTRNFQGVFPEFGGSERTFLFYDIHDGEFGDKSRSSKHLIEVWIPTLREAMVAVHDICQVDDDWVRPNKRPLPPSYSEARHWDGRRFFGFGECAPIIELLNKNVAELVVVPGTASLVYFFVKDGVPQ